MKITIKDTFTAPQRNACMGAINRYMNERLYEGKKGKETQESYPLNTEQRVLVHRTKKGIVARFEFMIKGQISEV